MLHDTELCMAMTACATGFCRLHRVEPPPDRAFHSLAKEAFLHQVKLIIVGGFNSLHSTVRLLIRRSIDFAVDKANEGWVVAHALYLTNSGACERLE